MAHTQLRSRPMEKGLKKRSTASIHAITKFQTSRGSLSLTKKNATLAEFLSSCLMKHSKTQKKYLKTKIATTAETMKN